jgi:excisionase family DNA binding protein
MWTASILSGRNGDPMTMQGDSGKSTGEVPEGRMIPFENWLSYAEVAMLLFCSLKTVYNRVSEHRLPHVLVKVGRTHRRIARVPPSTVRALARILKTAPYLFPDKDKEMNNGD